MLPEGWRDRLVPLANPNTGGVTAWCLEAHDLWVAKIAAGRSNDVGYCRALLAAGLVDAAVLSQRLALTPLPPERMALADGIIRSAAPGQAGEDS